MVEFETIINPPQEVFDQLAQLTSDPPENWCFKSEDYDLWKTTYDQLWLVTVVEKGTTNFVASVSLTRWDGPDGALYSIGMFYCKGKFRGQGFGKPIFQKVFDIIGDNNATLTGAVKMSAKYDKVFGFNKCPEHWHWFSSVKCADVKIPDTVSKEYLTNDWSEVDYEALTAYDRTICTRDRKKYITAWFKLPESVTRVVLNKSGQIVGYATIRPVLNNRLSPAPFYADNLEAAEVLLKDLLNSIPNWREYETFGFTYPGCNKDPVILLEKYSNSKDSISTVKFFRSQFTKKLIATPDQKVYSVSDNAHQFV
ncbi:hypothetical protein L5515_006703 [Caenorhabditis briggsae]|uniref:YitH/HolE acetyltransferase (GNAT) domain-containing protein n=1 Tax=Caenorhabditis briggsae TaxID=6238 RepID=A0AAE9F2Y1_CAEBR|nr:hypothetical protein L5515_006703 [Caenorhabditis briggsae]